MRTRNYIQNYYLKDSRLIALLTGRRPRPATARLGRLRRSCSRALPPRPPRWPPRRARPARSPPPAETIHKIVKNVYDDATP